MVKRYRAVTFLLIVFFTVLFWFFVGMIIVKPSIRYYEDSSIRLTVGSYSAGYCLPLSYCSNH
jgi:hypothetical protein